MKKGLLGRTILVNSGVVILINCQAQWVNDGLTGSQSLTSTTTGVTVGTTAGTPPSALTVRGTEMNTQTGEVFRTIGKSADFNYWRMYRNTDQIGRLFSKDGTNTSFNIQQMLENGSLWLRNYGDAGTNTDGLRLIDDKN